MYISFSDTSGDGLGGAAQGIIPVQDANGKMLGGSAAPTAELEEGVKREAKEVRNEMHKLEEYFERMMEAVERNTNKVAELAGSRKSIENEDVVSNEGSQRSSDANANGGGPIEVGILSGHLVRMNDLLSRNSQHIEQLAKKHYDSEEKLRKTMDAMASKNDNMDVERLSSHLDRIQNMMESSAKDRKDSVREIPEQQIDFSPLTERLEKVQEAVERNSALIKALLDEGMADSKPGTPFWGKDSATHPDVLPLTQHMERIHHAIEQQSGHMKALVGLANGERDGTDPGAVISPLAPLGEHLEQIYNAIEEGNSHAKESFPKADVGVLEKHLEALRRHSAKNNDHMQHLLESQNSTREAVEANGGEIDFTPMTEYLDAIRESNDNNAENIRQLLESRAQEATPSVDFTPLTQHLEAIRTATEQSTQQIRSLASSQQASATKSATSPGPDFTPLTDRLNKIHSTLQKQADLQTQTRGTGDAKFLMNALTSHLSKIQGITEQNATHVSSLREKQSSTQDKMHIAVAETSEQVRSLVQHTQDNEARIEAQNSQMRELMSGQREVVEVMRQLARSVVAQNQGTCDHVVVPPPRKMGRKVVGFVYDAKEGGV